MSQELLQNLKALAEKIAKDKANLQNIVPRGTTNYLGIFLNGNRNKWVCQLWLNGASKYIKTPKEARLNIADFSDIYKYKNELLESLKTRLK